MIATDWGLVISGAVLVTLIVIAAIACLLVESDPATCGMCGGSSWWRDRPCPRCCPPRSNDF